MAENSFDVRLARVEVRVNRLEKDISEMREALDSIRAGQIRLQWWIAGLIVATAIDIVIRLALP